MRKRDFDRLVKKKGGVWTNEYLTKKFKVLEMKYSRLENMYIKLAAKVLHGKTI